MTDHEWIVYDPNTTSTIATGVCATVELAKQAAEKAAAEYMPEDVGLYIRLTVETGFDEFITREYHDPEWEVQP